MYPLILNGQSYLRRQGCHGSQPQIVVPGNDNLLVGAQIAFGGLDRGVAEQELDLLQISPFFRQSLAQVRRRSWAPKCSIPICLDDCSTTDQSLRVSPLSFPLLENRTKQPGRLRCRLRSSRR
jgi:hypothetical protein